MSSRKKDTAERTDCEKLELFVRKYNELTETALAKKGFRPILGYIINNTSGLNMRLAQPDEEELRSFLLALRQFISKEEPVFLDHIYNICSKRLIGDELKVLLADSRKLWAKAQEVSGIELLIDGNKISGLEVWRIWTNGKYFHNDLRYQQMLGQASPESLAFLRFNFLTFIGMTTQCVRNLASFILKALDENKFDFEL